jgi:hypothetical protein
LRAALSDQTIDHIVDHGMHEFIDWVQRQLILIFGEIREAYCQSR